MYQVLVWISCRESNSNATIFSALKALIVGIPYREADMWENTGALPKIVIKVAFENGY